MNEEQIYVRWQDRIDAAIQRLEKRALALERENETLRSRLANLELPPLERRALALERENETLRSRLANLELPPLEPAPVKEEKKKPGRKLKKE